MTEKTITVRVPLENNPYDIFVGEGLLERVGELSSIALGTRRCAVISDHTVAELHSEKVLQSLSKAGFEPSLLSIPQGEASKSMEVVSDLCNRLIALRLDRKGAIFALGGGVVGDLAGFVASIHYRGVPLVQIPTTVVAQVDSAIGGKTGVNSPLGKNLIGTFHQPRLVLSDTATLGTLPERVFSEGLAEVIKHAVIADAEMLANLPPRRESNLTPLIARNAAIKAGIVSRDEYETKGIRALLNFGHTIGHAVESVAGYGALSHGECVAIGMVSALRLSVRMAGLPQDQANRVADVISACGLPLKIPSDLPMEKIVETLTRDKKFDRGAIRFVLTSSLGSAFVSERVTLDDIIETIGTLV